MINKLPKSLIEAAKKVLTESQTHIDIDGVQKHRYNSEGKLIHPTEEGIRNFHRWSEGNELKDEHGRPMVLYHGTSKDTDYSQFKVPKNGVWLTTDKKTASDYAKDNDSQDLKYDPDTRRYKEVNTASRVIPVYVKSDSTYTMTDDDHKKINVQNYKKAQGQFFDTLRGMHDTVSFGNGIYAVIGGKHQFKSAIGNVGGFSHKKSTLHESQTHIDVDGEMKHRYNSEGKLIHPSEEGIRNFHRWFGDSKTVDHEGKPLVVYHASTYGDISAFSPEKGVFGKAGYGSYFSNKDGANLFAEYGDKFQYPVSASGESKKVNITPVYIRSKNPLVVDHVDDLPPFLDRGQSFGVAKQYQKVKPKDVPPWVSSGYDSIITSETTSKKVHKTRGLSILDRDDPKATRFPVYVVHDPRNIKSAIGNVGDFHPEKSIITESISVPKEAYVGRVKTAVESGRYDVVPAKETDREIEFHITPKKPDNAIEYTARRGDSGKSWYDPKISELHTPYPEDDFPRTYARLKQGTGLSNEILDSKTHGVIFRGMSQEEFDSIKKTGKIQSHGAYNMEGQEGLTYYSKDPSQAQSYAHGFAPMHAKGTGQHKVYVVAVKDPGTGVYVSGTGENEVGIPHAISDKDILHVHEGTSYSASPGKYYVYKGWNGFEEGSSFGDSSSVGWKKIRYSKD